MLGGINLGKVLVYAFLLITFFSSVNLEIYQNLKQFFEIKDAYLVDQLLFYILLLVVLIHGYLTRRIRISITDSLVLLLFLLIPFITHSEILERYFYKEDFYFNLNVLRDGEVDFYYINSYFFTYPFLPIVVIYNFVGGAVHYYNFFTLILLSVSGFLLYKLNLIILPLKNNFVEVISILIALVYLTSPTYLDAYLWVSVGLEGGLMYSVMLLGIIYYLLFQKSKDSYYFLGAFIVLLVSLKTGFARVGFLPLIYLLIEILFISKRGISNLLIRGGLIIFPTILFLFNSGHLTKIFYPPSEQSTGLAENLYLLLAYLPHAAIPYEALLFLYEFFINSFISQISPFDFNFYFSLGLIITISLLMWVFILKNKVLSRYILFFVTGSLICLFFFVNFGSLGKIGKIETFDKALSTYSITIGHRYYQGVNILLMTAFFIIVSSFVLKYPKLIVLNAGLLIAIIMYNVPITKMHNRVFIKDYAAQNRAFYEGVLKAVPSDNRKKILYFTNGKKWTARIHADEHYLEAFYLSDTLILVNQESDVGEQMQKGSYKIGDVYAVYFDEPTLTLLDQTQEYRNKLLGANK